MALTQSTMLPLGTALPHFRLRDVCSGTSVSSAKDFEENSAILVMFICRHCPYVIHVQSELAKLGRDYEKKNLGMVAISSNDVTSHPDDAPHHLREMAKDLGFSFPYCYDETQEVAKDFTAACTPDFFIFNAEQKLVYRGQLDESRPGNGKPITGKDLRAALDAVLAGQPVAPEQRPSAGCNIKWKSGNEPQYA